MLHRIAAVYRCATQKQSAPKSRLRPKSKRDACPRNLSAGSRRRVQSQVLGVPKGLRMQDSGVGARYRIGYRRERVLIDQVNNWSLFVNDFLHAIEALFAF